MFMCYVYPKKGVDVLLAGIATHFVPSERLEDLKTDLLASQETNIEKILNEYQPNLNHEFSLAPHMSQIENCFSASSVEEIIERYVPRGFNQIISLCAYTRI